MHQLSLPLQLTDQANFTNFFAGLNQPLLQYLQEFISGQHDSYLYLWGQIGVGCSHLLQACCQQALEQNLTAVYLSFKYINDYAPIILEDLDLVSIVCLDDIQNIAGNAAWEEALFHFYNRMQVTRNRLIIAGHCVPNELNIQLPDLMSRLASGVITQIQPLTDDEKIIALQMRAKLRGFALPSKVAQFLLRRYPRNLAILFNVLDGLDEASLVSQRKLTIPFVKAVLKL